MDKVKYLGYVLIVWGVADIALSYMGTNVWYDWFGIALDVFFYTWSGAIAIVIGGALTRVGPSGEEEPKSE